MKSYKEHKSTLTWENGDPLVREASKIKFEVPDDMNIHEFKIMCIRLASSIGYHDNSIKRAFGKIEDVRTKSDQSLHDLIKQIKQVRDE